MVSTEASRKRETLACVPLSQDQKYVNSAAVSHQISLSVWSCAHSRPSTLETFYTSLCLVNNGCFHHTAIILVLL